jgi:hypothetical protein
VWWRDIWRGWRENMHIFSYMIIWKSFFDERNNFWQFSESLK